MSLSYPYGKVPSSIATVITERIERPMVCCGWCSTQMACRTARSGVSDDAKVEAHRMRAAGGRPHWAGSVATEQRAGAEKALAVNLIGINKAMVLVRAKGGYAVVCSLSYIKLPSYLKMQTNDFGHSVMVKGYRNADGVDYIGWFDPLWPQGSQGTWAKWSDVTDALWETGHSTTTAKYVPPTQRYTLHVAKGATVRSYRLQKPAGGSGLRCIARNKDGSYGTDTVWSRRGSQADCMAPVARKTCDGESSATTVLVTSGAFKDQHVRVGSAYGVTVTPKEA